MLFRSIVNSLRQLAQLPWFVRNVVLKVLLKLRLGGVIAKLTGRRPVWPY